LATALRVAVAILLSALLLACPAEEFHARLTGRTIRVAAEDSLDGTTGWRPEQREVLLGRVLRVLAATGDTWVASGTGSADVVIYAYPASSCAVEGSGRYVAGARYVEIDPACTPSEDVLAWVATHELLHWLTWDRHRWLGHVCAFPSEVADCHEEVFGPAILAPRIPDLGDGLSLDVYLRHADVRLLTVLSSAHGR
jgi:hypothetical protein